MPSDIKLEVFVKQVERLVDGWTKDLCDAILKLEDILVEKANLELIDAPSPDDKKKLDKLAKDLETAKKNIEAVNLGLKVSMMGITDPIQAEPQDLTKNLPTKIRELIKKKGVPLGKHATLTPDIGFDLKSRRIKSFGITVKW